MTFQSVPIDMWINSDLTSKYWTNTHLAPFSAEEWELRTDMLYPLMLLRWTN